jgi:NADH-quinone oxidoreductase subunit A
MRFIFLEEYGILLYFFVFALLLSCILFFLSYFFGAVHGDTEKLSAYECGFDPFQDARSTFDVRFYLVGILFIIFDLEVSFLFPWAVILGKLLWISLFSMTVFLLILTVGFIYE